MNLREVVEALGGRKFLLSVLAMAVGAAVEIWSPKGLSETLAIFLAGLSGSYGLANAFAKGKEHSRQASEDEEDVAVMEARKDEPSVSLGPSLEERLEALEGRVSLVEQAGESIMKTQSQVIEAVSRLAKKA